MLLTNSNYERVALYWEKDKARSAAKHRQPSFLWTVMRAYRVEIIYMVIVRLVGYGLLYIPPVLFSQLLQFINEYSVAVRDGTEPPALMSGFVISSAMFFFNIASTFTLGFTFQQNTDLGIQARAASIALIYRKSLKLSPQAKQSSTLGEITNHMAVDAERFELGVATYLLYQLLGWSLVAGLAVFAVLVPIQGVMASFMNGYQDEQLKWMDSRLRLMTEILSNIKIVKLYHWEVPFRKKIDALRAKELYALKIMATIRSILTIVFSSVTLLMALCTFWVFAYVGGPNMTPGKMTSEVVFVSITLFSIMSRPLGMVTVMISNAIATIVGMKRIQKFLLMEEIDTTVVRRYSRQPRTASSGKDSLAHQSLSVDIENGTFA
ncbi:Canalicular multispecific organic anion transporter 2, partial [Dissophora globulifera]